MARVNNRNKNSKWGDSLPSSERVYRKLREMILSGELPPQTRLVEVHFAEQFEVSRTPVREALKRLTAEKLVYADSVRGLVVREPEPDEIEDVYIVREALEAVAARLAARRITPDELRRLWAILESMREAVELGRTDVIVNTNIAFHDVIYRAAGNETLSRIVKELSDFVRRFSTEAFASSERANAVLEEHKAILEALERHDPETAGTASSSHLRAASGYLLTLHLKRAFGLKQPADETGPGGGPTPAEPSASGRS
jgi:DNA-binding GntR family transcriptional regulator